LAHRIQSLEREIADLVSPATLNDHEGVTLREHEFVNVLSPSCSSVAP
jgi:hypothetical protein